MFNITCRQPRICIGGECVGYDKCAVSFPCTSDSFGKRKNKKRKYLRGCPMFDKIDNLNFSYGLENCKQIKISLIKIK